MRRNILLLVSLVFLIFILFLAIGFLRNDRIEVVSLNQEVIELEPIIVEGNSNYVNPFDDYIDPLDQEILDLEYKDESQDSDGGRDWLCYEDIDCGSEYSEGPFCSGGDVFEDVHNFSCDGVCTENVDRVLVEECFAGCFEGECVRTFPFNCFENLDCGVDDFVGDRYCLPDDNVHQVYVVWTCLNPGTVDSMCSLGLQDREVDVCGDDLMCSEGFCVAE